MEIPNWVIEVQNSLVDNLVAQELVSKLDPLVAMPIVLMLVAFYTIKCDFIFDPN